MRDSQYKSCAVQNQFTAYLIAAIRNYKRTYLRRISTALRTELPMEGHSEVMELCEETDFFCGLSLMQRLENERLFAAMEQLSVCDLYFVEDKTFGVLDYAVYIENDDLAQAIAALPMDKRDIILLSYFLDMSDNEIAKLLNMVRSSVAYRRTSTLKLLKELMGGNTDDT